MNKKNNKILLALLLLLSMALVSSCTEKVNIPEEYNYDDVFKYIELGEYKNIEYQEEEAVVTQDEIDSVIKESLEKMATTKKVKKGKVEKDSVVNIDYMGVHNNMTFEGGSAQGVDVDMSDNNFLKDFVNQMVGHSVGDTFIIFVNMPDTYVIKELRGEEVAFQITINHIIKKVVPEYTLEYIKKNTDFDTVEDFEADVKKQILENKQEEIKTNQKNELLKIILGNSKYIKYPSENGKMHYDLLYSNYEKTAEDNDMTLKQYIKKELKVSNKEFEEELQKQTKSEIKAELILLAIAERENIDIGVDAYRKYVDDILKDEGTTLDDFKKQNGITITEYTERNNTYGAFIFEQVMNKIAK